jgi:hypothetical protein
MTLVRTFTDVDPFFQDPHPSFSIVDYRPAQYDHPSIYLKKQLDLSFSE